MRWQEIQRATQTCHHRGWVVMWLKEREDWDRFCGGGLEYHCCDDGGYGKLIGDGGDRANEGVVGGKITSRKPPYNASQAKI